MKDYNHLTLSRGGVRIPHSSDNSLPVSATATGEEGHARSERVVHGLLEEVKPSHAASVHVHELPQCVHNTSHEIDGTMAQAIAGRRGRGAITVRMLIYSVEERVGSARFNCYRKR